ncbi:MAG: hypothetical protein DI636_12610, partial [Pelagerythrobacter marensis]
MLVEYGPAAAPAEPVAPDAAPRAAAPQPEPARRPDARPEARPRPEAPRSAGREARAPRGGTRPPSPADAAPIDDGLPQALPRPRTMEMVTRIAGA